MNFRARKYWRITLLCRIVAWSRIGMIGRDWGKGEFYWVTMVSLPILESIYGLSHTKMVEWETRLRVRENAGSRGHNKR